MKIYTKEQVIKGFSQYGNMSEINARNIIDLLTPIELPSDEEEENNAESLTQNLQQHIGFNRGVKWMKEQIFNQTNNL
jgi:hypothetical protein